MYQSRLLYAGIITLFATAFCPVWAGKDSPADWQHRQVDWRMTGGLRIKAVHYPPGKSLPTRADRPGQSHKIVHKKKISTKRTIEPTNEGALSNLQSTSSVFAYVIDSPPIDGFVPWIVVAVTDRNSGELELNAVPGTTVTGNYLTSNPQSDYAVGIFDTGAGAHLMGYADATRAGLDNAYLTGSLIEITGVTGSVDAKISQPIGIFIDGLGALDPNHPGGPNEMLLDTSGMVGQTNVSIAVGQDPEPNMPDLPTAIGSPLSVYFAAAFYNDQPITVTHNSEIFTGPDLVFYDLEDANIPVYPNKIPLELRPMGGIAVQYVPCMLLGNCVGGESFAPGAPSLINGQNQLQSLFFVHSVDLTEGQKSAIDKDRFMFDCGAQITVVGSRVGARLGLDHNNPEFQVEIVGVTGIPIMAPGFYIDTLDIPALGQWLSLTNVPVVLLDVASPEGGTLDGIIGMNLFVEFNFVFHGGGLFGQSGDPYIEFQTIYDYTIADIAPDGGDNVVDVLDLERLARAWLAWETNPTSPNWDPVCDIAPLGQTDGKINILDYNVLAQYWLQGPDP